MFIEIKDIYNKVNVVNSNQIVTFDVKGERTTVLLSNQQQIFTELSVEEILGKVADRQAKR